MSVPGIGAPGDEADASSADEGRVSREGPSRGVSKLRCLLARAATIRQNATGAAVRMPRTLDPSESAAYFESVGGLAGQDISGTSQ